MKPFTKYGGIVASVILIAFGIGSIVVGLNGRSEVRNTLKQEQIVGTPDMDKQIANKPVDTGAKAKLFAAGIRKHTLEATGGQLYSQMGQFLTAAGKQTSDAKAAAIDKATGKPVPNAARDDLGDRDRPVDRAEHLVLRGERRHVRHGHGLRAAAHGHRLPGPRLPPPLGDGRSDRAPAPRPP